MKTMEQWKESKLNLEKFLQVGDEVDETIKSYFINVLPPKTATYNCIQIGEPYDINEKGQDTYFTLQRESNGWIFVGDKIKT